MQPPSNSSNSPATELGDPIESPTLNIRDPSHCPIFHVDPEDNGEFQDAVLRFYFKHIDPWCPILHERTFRSKFGDDSNEEDHLIFEAMIATTMRFFTKEIPSGEERRQLSQAFADRVMRYAVRRSSLSVLQALVILAWDAMGCENGPFAWNILAVSTNIAVQLDLTVEWTAVADFKESISTTRGVKLPEPKNWLEREYRRRLFWMVYLLDRYSHFTTAFKFHLDETEIARWLPCDTFCFDKADDWLKVGAYKTKFLEILQSEQSLQDHRNLGPFSFYVEAVHIQSMVQEFLRRPMNMTDSLEKDRWWIQHAELQGYLDRWRKAVLSKHNLMPANCSKRDKIASREDFERVMLHATYYT